MNIAELEKMRQKARTISVLNAVLIAFWFVPFFKLISVIGALALYFFVTRRIVSDYKVAFKANVVKASLENVFSELEYDPNNGIGREMIEKSELFMQGNHYDSNDLIHAKYKNVEFRQADISIQDHTTTRDPNGNEVADIQQYFKGRLILFTFNKATTAPVQVVGKHFNRGSSDGVIGKLTRGFQNNTSRKKVMMESDEFNKNFEVLAADPHSAYYLLTPPIIDAITHLSKVYNNNIALAFKDNTLFVAVYHKKDSLEPKILNGTTIINEQCKIQQEIKIITDFIDLMSLEKNIFVMGTNALLKQEKKI